jgi:hypothetical protein
MASYYLAPSLKLAASELFPGFPRKGSSDGWIGDASHSARKSDHNPDWAAGGVVRAIDGDKDGNRLPMSRILELVIADVRTEYVIWEGHIYSRAFSFRKRKYTGSNGHYAHMHVSLRHGRSYEISTKSWLSGVHVVEPLPVPAPDVMRIPANVLVAQHRRAWQQWPFIDDIERKYNLPRFLLYAVGSRETNLQNIQGDFSQRKGETSKRYHGFGVWQRDIQHGIPAGWMDNVLEQCEWSAQLLANNIARFGLLGGVNAYNSGQPLTEKTTGKDYGPDVLARMEYLQAVTGVEDEEDDDMIKYGLITPRGGGPIFGVFVVPEEMELSDGTILEPGMLAKVGFTNGSILEVVTNAGYVKPGQPLTQLGPEEWDRIPHVANV